jgi:putative hydrolase of the HAD superfamily
MIRAIIFDIGNVILRFDFNHALRKLTHHDVPAAKAMIDLLEPVKLAYEGGRMSRADFLKQARAILSFAGTDEEFVAAWEDIFTENWPMIELVDRLHERLPLYLLSNTSDIHRDFCFRRFPVFQRFRAGVYSFEAKVSKPEPEIYRLAERHFGVNPAETLFIDDLSANIESARSCGFLAHHYHHDRHEALLEELRAGGV